MNPDDGMSYNMLQIIKDEYIKGDFAQAEAYAVSLTSTLFQSKDGSDFWEKSGASLVVALIFAVIHRALSENEPHKITMRNVYELLTQLGSINEVDEGGVEHNALADYMMGLPDDSIAKKQYATTEFAGGNTRASILSTASSTLSIFVSEKLSRMGSANSVDFTRVGFNKRMRVRFDHSYNYKRGVIHYGYGKPDCQTSNFKVDNLGYMENYFKRKMQAEDIIRIELDGKVFEYQFYREKPVRGFVSVDKKRIEYDPYTNERIYPEEAYVRPDRQYEDIVSINCFYSEKPVAVFMVIPDYDTSVHVVASIFISQLYTMLARRASESGGKCHQRVKFRLDEFGNMPAIHDMANVLTVCLGRNILFEIYVQGYSQVFAKYGQEDGETIKDNCQNHIYIKSTNKETNEEISAKCGNKTVTEASRTVGGGSDFSEQMSVGQAPLIHPEKLPKFVRGETVVLRFLKSNDLSYKSIRPEPIYNTNEMKLPFRFEFLGDDFEPANQFADFDIPSLHRHINLSEYFIDWKHQPKKYELQANGYIAKLKLSKEDMNSIRDLCRTLTSGEELYKRISEAPTLDSMTTTIHSYLDHISMGGKEAYEIEGKIIAMVRNLEKRKMMAQANNGNESKDKEISNDVSVRKEQTENDALYVSEYYFSTHKHLVEQYLKEHLNDDILYEELMNVDMETFKQILIEHDRVDVFKRTESLRLEVG